MSLMCGACEETIYRPFALLLLVDSAAEPPAEERHLPNVALCEDCRAKLPKRVLRKRFASVPVPGRSREVLAIADADSGLNPFWGSKQWSSIRVDYGTLRFLPSAVVDRLLPQATTRLRGDRLEAKAAAYVRAVRELTAGR